MIRIIAQRKLLYLIAGILTGGSLLALALWGLRPGIDFTGGSLLEVEIAGELPTAEAVNESLASLNLGDTTVQSAGERGFILRFQTVDEPTHQQVLRALQDRFGAEEVRFESVGPVIGKELQRKSTIALILVLIGIAVYVAWAFRKVSQPVQSWKYGVLTLVAAAHDVIIPMGLFAVLGRFAGVEVGTSFIAALLTILGYSVNDTIVVFDRVRENLLRSRGDFGEIVERSVQQTFARSINTTATSLFAILAVLFFGGETVRPLALALTVGIAAGAYSSIFIASPLLVTWEKHSKR
ncbi:MAG: protein translocase subunit SecF [Patescibacteria group bacterium]